MSARREIATGPEPSSPPQPQPPPVPAQGESQSVTPSAADSDHPRSEQKQPRRHGVEVISVELPDASGPEREYSDLSRYTPPYSTPVKPYRFSEHIHRDRHIFLKGASVGIGCGSDAGRSPAEERVTLLPGWSGGGRGRGGGGSGGGVSSACSSSLDGCGYSVDGIWNVFYRGKRVQSMALGQDRLPTLNRVQLGLSSAECSKLQQEQRRRHPHIRPHHHHAANARRPFNEQLNTYVDTQKRIRAVQSLEELYASSPPPAFPYLATPPTPKRRQPPSRPAAVRLQAATTAPQAPTRGSQSLTRTLTSFNIKKPPPPLVPALPLTTITAVENPVGPMTTSSPFSQRLNNNDAAAAAAAAAATATATAKSVTFRDPDAELMEARRALEATKQVSSNKNYADYFLSKDLTQGTFGHLFESYPKRVLTVHPGRMVRQRTDVAVPRSRMKLLQ